MQRELKRILLCCALLLSCCSPVQASPQEDYSADSVVTGSEDYYDDAEDSETEAPRQVIYNRQSPSEARWLEAVSDDAYSYRTTRESIPTPPEPPRETPAWIRLLVRFFSFFASTPGKIILWSALVLIVGYIVYRVVVGDGGLFSRRDLSPTPAAPGELSPETLLDTGWEAQMREALAAGDHRLAIRFGYLHLLQQLQLRGLIDFRADKTNIAYYRELGEAWRPEFRTITRVYEFAWYGNVLPDEATLSRYPADLETFLQRIPRS